ncbi:MAG: MbtH family NRPS accessory protein [Planctomycetes bacterium]|nr:MbtH family NRPS accessory protein [Planctomycetota bacterium]
MSTDEDSIVYEVVVNHEEQYSIWPEYKGDPPLSWKKTGKRGPKTDCLAHIDEVWTDMRPLSLRKQMEEMEKRRPELEAEEARRREEAEKKPKDPRDDLVKFLCDGDHPVEAALRPEKTVTVFKDAIDRGYVHLKFTDTRGGTELGVQLDNDLSDFSKADYENATGVVHIIGGLTLNYARVRCTANIDLATLAGRGHLEPIQE